MKRVATLLVGIRTDLELTAKWWHRAFVVVFTLTSIGVLVLGALFFYSDPPVRIANVAIIQNLREFNDSHANLRSTLPSFEALGAVGKLDEKGEIFPYHIDDTEMFCSGDMTHSLTQLRDFLRRAEQNSEISDDDVQTFFKNKKLDDGKAHCIGRPDTPKQSDIVVYRVRKRAIAKSWLTAVSKAAAALVVWYLLTANIYYRGLIFIVCGPKRRYPASTGGAVV